MFLRPAFNTHDPTVQLINRPLLSLSGCVIDYKLDIYADHIKPPNSRKLFTERSMS